MVNTRCRYGIPTSRPTLAANDCWPFLGLTVHVGSRNQPTLGVGQNMKSSVKAALTVVDLSSPLSVLEIDGPTPIMNSKVAEMRKGFLKIMSPDNSVCPVVPSIVRPASISNQFSMTLFSTANVPPKLAPSCDGHSPAGP